MMVTKYFGWYDNMPKHTNGSTTNLPPSVDVEGPNLVDDDNNIDDNQMVDLLQEAQILLFEGSKNNQLATTLLLLKCFAVFGILIAFANELLKLLSEVLPERNTYLNHTMKVGSIYQSWE